MSAQARNAGVSESGNSGLIQSGHDQLGCRKAALHSGSSAEGLT
jgi:hypothetical protein